MSNSDDAYRESLNEERYLNHLKKETRRKKLKSAQKILKRNRQARRARRKNWIPDSLEDWDDLDLEETERIMPLDEGERRLEMERMADSITAAAEKEPDESGPESSGQPGVVLEVSQGLCRVELDSGGGILLCHLRGSLSAAETGFTNVVAVGDEVLVSQDGSGKGVVEAVRPRRSALARPDVFLPHLQQVIVANPDQLLIVSSWQEPPLWLELLDRYLIAAERNHLPVVICINKMDLVEDEAECSATLQPYRALGYELMLTSALTGRGIEALHRRLRDRTTVLAGLSGVGKSSLLTAIQPDLALRVNAVSETSGEGRHTTTQASLIRLEARTAVIDTPGIREFGLSGLSGPELTGFYPEFAAEAGRCRFADCVHIHEPDCAVKAGVEQGTISASRYHNYRKILKTL